MTADGASRQAIEAHYDVSRDFYRLWLDEAMVYSCALWPAAVDDDLEAAQVAKLAWHADSAGVGAGARVLDIGCGWGAMLRYLRDERGAGEIVGLTLSRDQADAAGPAARLEDWRDHEPSAPYDAIVSIGAFEHFARHELTTDERRAVYRHFFDRCSAWLSPGGRLSLQTIAYEDFDPEQGSASSFFTDEVFPVSCLPRLAKISGVKCNPAVGAAAEPGWRMMALRNDGPQYEATLRLWQRRLEAGRDRATELVGRATFRRYLRYLRVSRAMFDRRVCTLYRLTLERR